MRHERDLAHRARGDLRRAGAGRFAGLVAIGGGIVLVPVVHYGLIADDATANQAAHVAVCTSLATIMPAALLFCLGVSRLTCWQTYCVRTWTETRQGAADDQTGVAR